MGVRGSLPGHVPVVRHGSESEISRSEISMEMNGGGDGAILEPMMRSGRRSWRSAGRGVSLGKRSNCADRDEVRRSS